MKVYYIIYITIHIFVVVILMLVRGNISTCSNCKQINKASFLLIIIILPLRFVLIKQGCLKSGPPLKKLRAVKVFTRNKRLKEENKTTRNFIIFLIYLMMIRLFFVY